MTTQEREDTRPAWDKIAPGYDKTNTPTQMWLGNEGLRRAELRAGMRFLDVAAGSGALSIPAARLGAQVLATDQSPVMLELLRARARQEGLNIETRVMDGHALELDDNSFDMAGSQFGVMLFPDMPKGISEMVRVVKPGGRVLMNVYGDPHKIEFFGFFVGAIQSVRPDFTWPSDGSSSAALPTAGSGEAAQGVRHRQVITAPRRAVPSTRGRAGTPRRTTRRMGRAQAGRFVGGWPRSRWERSAGASTVTTGTAPTRLAQGMGPKRIRLNQRHPLALTPSLWLVAAHVSWRLVIAR